VGGLKLAWLSAKVSFYGLYLYNEGQVRLWPYPRANGCHTIDVLRRLRAEVPDRKLLVVWDGAPYHRAKAVQEVACELGITLMPLPGYSPDLMPVEALWRWLREDVTYHHCHASAEDLTRGLGRSRRASTKILGACRPPLGQGLPQPRRGETTLLNLDAV
jgi:transposase